MLNTSSKIAVCGAGAMGAGIAQVAAQAGHSVWVLDRDKAALERGKTSLKQSVDFLLKKGKITQDDAISLQARIQWTLDANQLSESDLLIEAILENHDIKLKLFQKLESILSQDAVLATNTSSLSVTSLSAKLKRPQQFIGLHFFNPAPVMKLVEVIAGQLSDEKIIADAQSLMNKWGKTAVIARDVPGFIVNRVARPFYGEAWKALQENISDAATIDFLYRDLAGFRMGPLELGDLIGHDINSTAAESVFHAYFGKTRFVPSLMQMQLAQSGLLGRKSGRGIYDYADSTKKPEPIFEAAIESGEIFRGPDCDNFTTLGQLDSSLPPLTWRVDKVLISFTNGKSARHLAKEKNISVAVLDYVLDFEKSISLAYSCSNEKADHAARTLITAMNKKAVKIADRPGALIFRTLLQLVNAAADAYLDNVASDTDIDKAMRFGVNYPFGPLAWAKDFGLEQCITALTHIAEETGEYSMYLPNHKLRGLDA